MACQTSQNLDLYLVVEKKKTKSINVEYQVQVRYWVARNHLHDYKIYVIVIFMFDEDFFNSLLQPLGNNP
jgi:hypothetical protein